MVGSMGLALGCAVSPAGTATPSLTPSLTASPVKAGCPNLEDRLYQLTLSPDPAALAARSNLFYSQGRVRVVIELPSAESPAPSGYGLTVESRAQALVQALVPVDALCALAADPLVKSVRAPLPRLPLSQ
ncbi:MAG: hypothetical protein HYU86_07535 [Chloroflexi bacterium]|nr:hypothetical protein [Chloroflexota bacterium]